MTGKDLVGSTIGCAYVGQICDQNWGYNINEAHFTSTYANRVALIAHELGHNWSASHCQDSPNGCNIMCNFVAGCSGNVTSFSPDPKAQIIDHRSSRTCLSNAVYVDRLALAPWHGTQNQPYKFLEPGANCSLHDWVHRRELHVDAGTYDEGILLLNGFVHLVPAGGVVTIE